MEQGGGSSNNYKGRNSASVEVRGGDNASRE